MKNIDICLITDSSYSEHVGAVIVSILANSKSNEYIRFHIIETGILEEDKNNLLQLKYIKNCDIYFYYYNHSYGRSLYKDKLTYNTHVSAAALVKFEIHNILNKLDKVLYLDCDIIVNNSLYDFWNTDITQHYLAVADMPKKYKNTYNILKSLNMDPTKYKYFNSGVMLLNLYVFRNEKIDVRYQCRNFFDYGYNRGNTVSNIKPYNRTEICYTPATAVYIDYNGNVMPCCNFRSDIPQHKKFIMGNLKKNTIQEIRNGKKFQNFMKSVCKVGEKPSPCNTCRMGTYRLY